LTTEDSSWDQVQSYSYHVWHGDDYQLKQMIIKSNELRVAGVTLQEVFPPEHEYVAPCRCMRGAGIIRRSPHAGADTW